MTMGVASPRHRSRVPVLVTGVAVLYVAAFALASRSPSYSSVGAFVVVPIIGLLGLAAAVALARRETDPILRRIIVGGFVLKLGAALVMYGVTFGIYGSGDAQLYHTSGEVVAAGIWDGEFGRGLGRLTGTGFLQLFTGMVYAVTGPTRLGGFVVFSLLSWVGLYLFYRALPPTVQGGDRRLYAALVFLLPSLLVWPSTIGKEPWMMLTLGAAAYGASRLLQHRAGLVWLVLGLAGMTVVRPHMSVLVLAGIAGALVLSRVGATRGTGMMGRVLVTGVLLVAGALIATQLLDFFGIDRLSAASAEQVLDRTNAQTSLGGSQFTNAAVRSPASLPLAFVSVVFRPFPFEAHNLTSLVASLEGVFLMVLMWKRRASLLRLPRAVRDSPYVAFAATYTLGFIIAFSNFNNFGLLARERTQLYPLLLVLLFVIPREVTKQGARRQPHEYEAAAEPVTA